MGVSTLVIVGAGIMGLSTAVAAKKKYPASTIHLVDFKSPIPPASRDSSRIVRAAYASEAYRALSQEALVMWETDPLYKSFFHKTGWTVVQKGEAMSIPAGATKVPTERFREMWPRAKLDGDETITEDEDLGWAEAKNAIDAILDHTKSIGVIYHDIEVSGLHYADSEQRVCTGVEFKNGNLLKGSVLLAMGHSTLHFLQLCGKPLDAGVVQIAGVSVMEVKLNEEQYQMYKDNGILLFPGKGEILPPRSDRILKINNARSFSIPKLPLPENIVYPKPDAPIFKENLELLNWYDPELTSAEVVSKRFCFDAISGTQDFIITNAPGSEDLFVAFGGAFHSWKFFPVIGKYIVKMIDNELPDTWKDRWGGRAGYEGELIHEEVIPKRGFPE